MNKRDRIESSRRRTGYVTEDGKVVLIVVRYEMKRRTSKSASTFDVASFDRTRSISIGLRATAGCTAVGALVAAAAADHDRPARAARWRVLLVLNRRERCRFRFRRT